jgi:hypothetical protein
VLFECIEKSRLLKSSHFIVHEGSTVQRQHKLKYTCTHKKTRGSGVVKALCYKLDGRGFHTR